MMIAQFLSKICTKTKRRERQKVGKSPLFRQKNLVFIQVSEK